MQHVKDHLVGFHRCCVTFSFSQMIKKFEKQCTFCVKKPFAARRHADSKEKDSGVFLCPLSIKNFLSAKGEGGYGFFEELVFT